MSGAILSSGSDFADVVNIFVNLIDGVIGIIIALTFAYLLWQIFMTWFVKGGDPAEIEKGRQSVLIGILVLVAIFGLWGIVYIIRLTFFGV